MSNFNAGDKVGSIDTAVVMSASSSGTAVELGAWEYAMFSIEWAGADQLDATCWLEVSRTGTSGWEIYPDSTVAMASAAGAHHWDVWLRAIPYVRVGFGHGTATAGTFNTYYRNEVPV